MPELERVRPPFEQIADYYAAQIANGTLPPGARLPSEAELRSQWHVSKATINKAVAKLKAAGLITTQVGIGATVAPREA